MCSKDFQNRPASTSCFQNKTVVGMKSNYLSVAFFLHRLIKVTAVHLNTFPVLYMFVKAALISAALEIADKIMHF